MNIGIEVSQSIFQFYHLDMSCLCTVCFMLSFVAALHQLWLPVINIHEYRDTLFFFAHLSETFSVVHFMQIFTTELY